MRAPALQVDGLRLAMDEPEAEERISRIRVALDGIWDDILALYLGRAWVALGYQSWEALCDARLEVRPKLPPEERRPVVRQLTGAGMSTRAVAAAIGVSKNTINRDQAGVPNGTPEPSPGVSNETPEPDSQADRSTTVPNGTVARREVTSLDGKTRTYPPATITVPDSAELRAASRRQQFARAVRRATGLYDFDAAEMAHLSPDMLRLLQSHAEWARQFVAEFEKHTTGLRVVDGGRS